MTSGGSGDIEQRPTAPDPSLSLDLPASDTFLDLIRTGVGRMARRAGFSFDGIEDLALAANEAAGLLLSASPERLHIEVLEADGSSPGLVLRISAAGCRGTWPPPALEQDVKWQVLEALSDAIQLHPEGSTGFIITQHVK